MSFEWTETMLEEVVEINPKYYIRKRSLGKRVAMEDLLPFTREVQKYQIGKYNGGSKFQNGDTLLARITPCLENGKTAYVDFLDKDEIGFGSTEFIVLKAKQGKTDDKFVYYLSVSPEFRNMAIKSMTGTSGRQRAQVDAIAKWRFFLPPLDEQKGISRLLSSLDDKIELNHAINKNLEEIAQALFKRWFVDYEFPNENGEPYKSSGGEFVESELGPIPKGWEITSLRQIIDVNPKRELKRGEPAPHVEMKDLSSRYARVTNSVIKVVSSSGSRFVNGDVLLARITPCLENGKTAFVDFLDENQVGWGSTEFTILRSKPDIPNEFTYFLVTTDKFRTHAITNMTGSSGRQRVPNSAILDYRIPLPRNKNLLIQFGDFAGSVFQMMKKNDDENRTLSEVRDTLLPKLMSGEIRVPVEQD